MSGDDLRALLRTDGVTHVPGVYDPVTAALAVRAGHHAVHLSGAAVSALMLGHPDLDLVPATQIADRAATLTPALNGIPLLADADTGYGTPMDAVWTGQAYARAGISGLLLSDRDVADSALTAAKLRALATEVPQLAVIARTEVYGVKGLDEAIFRCLLYAEAGADAVLAAGVDDLAALAKIRAALPGVPLVVPRSDGGDRTAPADAQLAAVGVRLVLHPVAALLAALRAASLTYRAIADTGTPDRVDRMPLAAVTDMSESVRPPRPRPPFEPAARHTSIAGAPYGGAPRGGAPHAGAPFAGTRASRADGRSRSRFGDVGFPDLAGRLDT